MADTRTSVKDRFEANLATWISAHPSGFGNSDAITTIRTNTTSDSELLAYRELLADLVADYITLGSYVMDDWATILDANDDKAYARAVAYFDEVLNGMDTILRPIVRAVS